MTSVMNGSRTRVRYEVRGVVQGVGFRPAVYRVATKLDLAGFVGNDASHVFIEVEGRTDDVDRFVHQLRADAPPLARIDSVVRTACRGGATDERGFHIVESQRGPGEVTLVPPDVATCGQCRDELLNPTNRRFLHPFITCTDCGPRFTIIASMPYDRPNTTMAHFALCPSCAAEYHDPASRRYHAQPISCHDCGPQLTLRSGTESVTGPEAIAATCHALASGEIVAIKGLGGFHLACDATNDRSVSLLRQRKRRPDKPLAVLVRDLDHAQQIAALSKLEASALASSAAPIVLAEAKLGALSRLVAPNNPLVGVMAASNPVHHLLFEQVDFPLVMTSANRVGEPLAYTTKAIDSLADLYDRVLDHDRDILVPCDDSVVRVIDGQLVPIRRARGYAPLPVALPTAGPSVLAAGGELKNTFCITTGSHAWVSQHLGDMENLETLESFETTVSQYCTMYGIEPTVVAADKHPGYLSSAWARRQPQSIVEVQHHHAHIASVMAEHGLAPTDQVVGFAFDGTGFGDDGSIWGGEVLIANALGFTRVAHLASLPLVGGEVAVRKPYRIALGLLYEAGLGWDQQLSCVRAAGDEVHLLVQQLRNRTAVAQTSSIGRLFDGVASLLGLRHEVSFEAQAAIDLEFAARRALARQPESPLDRYCIDLHDGVWQWKPLVGAVTRDLTDNVCVEDIAAAFHLAVANAVAETARSVCHEHARSTVVLSGGVFQNAVLTEMCASRLRASGLTVLTHQQVPPNDGGLALGQAFVAQHRSQVKE